MGRRQTDQTGRPEIVGTSETHVYAAVEDPKSYAGFTGKQYAPDLIAAREWDFVRANIDRTVVPFYPTTMPNLALQGPANLRANSPKHRTRVNRAIDLIANCAPPPLQGGITAVRTSDRGTDRAAWHPTLLDLMGTKQMTPGDLDGLNFAPTLLGKK